MTAYRLRRARRHFAVLTVFCTFGLTPAWAASNYTLFESGQVRPLAQLGGRLFAVNTPDNRLEIFDVTAAGLSHLSSVPVGLEPVAVAARSATEVWVVNHLSDSVSIVDVSDASAPHVVRTLLVGDEPRDIVFAGPGGNRAFITTAHRGQNTPLQTPKCVGGPNDGATCGGNMSACPGGACNVADLMKPGVGRADVWVFDASALGTSLGGMPEAILTLFGDTPRALAVSPDGNTVYAAVFHSGNRTTTVGEATVCNGGGSASPCGNVCASGPNMHANCVTDSACPSSTCVVRSPGGLPPPNTDHNGLPQPEVGLIVKYDGTHWLDELGRHWDNTINFALPDEDVFAIDAGLPVPAQSAVYTGVGTILFNMAVNPTNGHVYVTNTDAQNEIRFEGVGAFATLFKPGGEPPSVRGHLAESRITVLDGASVTPRHLNKHIDYTTCCAATPNAENDASLAFPLGMAVSSDGLTIYVAGFGSSKIGVYATSDLEGDTFTPGATDVTLTGLGACPGGSCGPTGLVLDEVNTHLYVLTRFDNGISTVSTATGMEVAHLPLHNPEPASIVNGRRFNYDARFTSSHGDSACASCHIFSDFDSLAWDLGDPDGNILNNPGPFKVGPFASPPAVYKDFHPLKGPMTTQSLRGMANHGPMHWRGDRTGGNDAASAQPDSGAFNEQAGFKKFNVAFPGLLGRNAQLTTGEMQAYTDFILQVTYPPNPISNFNSASNDEIAGRSFFDNPITDTLQTCNGCHRVDTAGNASFGVDKPGFFGSDGQSTFEGESQHFKIPHLRNLYQKVGMFGLEAVPGVNPGDNLFMGDQIRGFGFVHDGSVDTLFRFHNASLFNQSGGNPNGIPLGAAGDRERRQIETFMLAFPSNLDAIVGQQITRNSTNVFPAVGRVDTLINNANGGLCDLVVKGRIAGEDRGYLYVGSNAFVSDRANDPPINRMTLDNKANTAGQELTFTCVPPGSGVRIGLDRDADGYGDRDELDLGSDPENPASIPSGGIQICASTSPFTFKSARVTDKSGNLSLIAVDVPLTTYAQETISVELVGLLFSRSYSATIPGASILLKGKSYKYTAPGGSTGLIRILVKENSKAPGLFKVTAKTKKAWPAGTFIETPASTVVLLNVGGQCFFGNVTKLKF
jgi:DNA-binding beta-propeller fold protein YncE